MGNENKKLTSKDISNLKKETRFTKGEVLEIYHDFLQQFPDGKVSLENWKLHYQKIFKNTSSDSYAEYTFHRFDTNLDGVLDFRELLTIVSIQTRGTLEEKLMTIFEMYDQNSDGYISRDEILEVMTAFCNFMKNVNHSLNDETLPLRYVEEVFTSLDTNRDGKLSLEEYLSGLCNRPDLSEIFLQTFCPPI